MTDRPDLDDAALIRLRDRGALPADLSDGDHARVAAWDRQDAALRVLYDPIADEPVPDRLRLIPDIGERTGHEPWLRRAAAAAAILLIGAGGGFLVGRTLPADAPNALASEALRAHETFAVEVRHPVEVAASDEAHLVAWLSKRLGHDLRPPDFGDAGFRLIGGRVLPEAEGTAAMLMYEDAMGRRLSLYVTRRPGAAETAFRFMDRGAANGFWWIDGGLGCAIVGDVPRDALRALAVSAYDQLI